MMHPITRRGFTALAGGLLVSAKAFAQAQVPASAQPQAPLITRPIPSSGERIPAVGLGTASVFNTNDQATQSKANAVVQALLQNGGRLIDTASTYGDAESVLGAVMAAAGVRDKLFVATKLESPDPDELKRSLSRLKTARVDLLQLHNVSSEQQSLQRFRDWKQQGL
jgi:aryl-alcohol dehydrogenase-like predicted oxidoreductase